MPKPTNPLLNDPKPEADPPGAKAPADTPADEPLGEPGKKALEAERAARAQAEKDKAALQKQLDEIEASKLSDVERMQKEAQEARDALPKAIAETFREVAVAFGGVSQEDAELLLTGSDKETLTKQLARLVERSPKGPAPDPSQGGSGDHLPLNGDPLLAGIKQKLGIS